MTTLPYYVIPKYDRQHKEVVLFFPDAPANLGCILSYVRVGEHSEADMGYFSKCRRVPPLKEARAQLHRLLNIIRNRLDKSEHIEIRHRDTSTFQRVRWSRYQPEESRA